MKPRQVTFGDVCTFASSGPLRKRSTEPGLFDHIKLLMTNNLLALIPDVSFLFFIWEGSILNQICHPWVI